jgi:hypothetical protein
LHVSLTCSPRLHLHPPAAEKELLLTFREGIANWEEAQAAWGLNGWCTKAGDDEDCVAPVCTWGGVE